MRVKNRPSPPPNTVFTTIPFDNHKLTGLHNFVMKVGKCRFGKFFSAFALYFKMLSTRDRIFIRELSSNIGKLLQQLAKFLLHSVYHTTENNFFYSKIQIDTNE